MTQKEYSHHPPNIFTSQRFPSGSIDQESEDYPHLLKQIASPPKNLFFKGNLELLSLPRIAVVGSRKMAYSSSKTANKIGFELAQKGIGIVSGGAFGCDITTHMGALQSTRYPCPCILILPGGTENLFPQSHEHLFMRILERGGLILSENEPHYHPRNYDFPKRNRIISGLCTETIVIQCAKKSGAMITARLSVAQGREVIVFLPEEDDIRFSGCLALKEEGASYFESASEILERIHQSHSEG